MTLQWKKRSTDKGAGGWNKGGEARRDHKRLRSRPGRVSGL